MAKENKKKTRKKIKFSRQSIFIVLAILLFGLIVWLTISNFIFIIKGLNDTFGSNLESVQPITNFDKKGFDSLGIIN
ncbi:MAG: hypothetical protein WDZ80_03950 [Candidatus Paceibacterota bacterium]